MCHAIARDFSLLECEKEFSPLKNIIVLLEKCEILNLSRKKREEKGFCCNIIHNNGGECDLKLMHNKFCSNVRRKVFMTFYRFFRLLFKHRIRTEEENLLLFET